MQDRGLFTRSGLGLIILTISVWGNGLLAQTPLIDFEPTESYQGFEGLLYDGSNQRPAALTAAAPAIEPINGRIVMASLGFSNVQQEFAAFMGQVEVLQNDSGSGVNPDLELVNLATPGCVASSTSSLEARNGRCWGSFLNKLSAAGISPAEVQVIWMKVYSTTRGLEFPAYLPLWSEDVHGTLDTALQQFPNLKQVYLSSRIYSYEDPTFPSLSPEPYAYQSGFAVKELVAEQHPGLWVSWGPYLWANGAEPRSDGLVWLPDDFQSDGTHPSSMGASKVSEMLLGFFGSDEAASQWFLADGTVVVTPEALLQELIADYPNLPEDEVLSRLEEILSLLW